MKPKDANKGRSKSNQRAPQAKGQFNTMDGNIDVLMKNQTQTLAGVSAAQNRSNKKYPQQFQNATAVNPNAAHQRDLTNVNYQYVQQLQIQQQLYETAPDQQQNRGAGISRAAANQQLAQQVNHLNQKQLAALTKQHQARLRNNSSGAHMKTQGAPEPGPGVTDTHQLLMKNEAQGGKRSLQAGGELPQQQQQQQQFIEAFPQEVMDPTGEVMARFKKAQSNTARKHSSVKRNQGQSEKRDARLEQNAQHQQWMNQTLPSNLMAVSKVEGGGSGGSGGGSGGCSGSQDQINQMSAGQQTQLVDSNGNQIVRGQQLVPNKNGGSPYGHEQQMYYMQQPHYTNVKNRLPVDQIQHIRATRNLTRQELLNPAPFAGSVTGSGPTNLAVHPQQQLLIQQQVVACASSDLQIPTLPKGQSTTKEGKKVARDGSNRGLFDAVQNVLGHQSSKQRIQNRAGSNVTQQNVGSKKGGANAVNQGIAAAVGLNNSVTHQPKKAPAVLNGNNVHVVLNGKNSGHLTEKDARDARDLRGRQDSAQFLDGQMMTPGSIMQQQNHFLVQQHSNGRKTQLHTINVAENAVGNHAAQKGSRQSSKLRKNVSAMRNANNNQQTSANTGKNGQRVSQQRRFNNTTLDNYQHQVQQNQLNAINQAANGNMSGTAVQIHQFDQSNQRTLVPQNPQMAPGQSRSVLRQNQQQKQYLNNFIPSNKFAANKNQDATQVRVKNQDFHGKQGEPAPRAQSTLKAAAPSGGGQNYKAPLHQLVSGQTTKNLSNAQFNNYLMQQQQMENHVGGQSPLLKQNNLALIHKRSESVTNQRPPHQEGMHPQAHPVPQMQANLENKIYYQKTQSIPVAKAQQQAKYHTAKQQTMDQQHNMDSLNMTTKAQSNTAKKCDSEQSAQSGANFEQNQNGAGGGLQMRRNQPHNFSNVSEKSSIMGDYGGTHTTMHNVNPSLKKSKQGMPTNGGSQDAAVQQKFFANRNGNATGPNTTSNSAVTQGSAAGTNSSLVQGTDAGNQLLVSNQKNRSSMGRRGQQTVGHGGLRAAGPLGSQGSQDEIDQLPIQMPSAGMPGGSRHPSSQTKNRNAMNHHKYNTQIIAMPDLSSAVAVTANANPRAVGANPGSGAGGQHQHIMAAGPAPPGSGSNPAFQKSSANSNKRTGSRQGNNRRIVISQKQHDQQQYLMQQKPGAFQQQEPLQTLQTLHLQQPQLKNVIKAAAKGSAATAGINPTQLATLKNNKGVHQKGRSVVPQNRTIPVMAQQATGHARAGGHQQQDSQFASPGSNGQAMIDNNAEQLAVVQPGRIHQAEAPRRNAAHGEIEDDDAVDVGSLAQSTLGEIDPTNHVHVTSDDFHDQGEEDDADEDEDPDGDDGHDYELGPGVNDIILQQTNEVEYDPLGRGGSKQYVVGALASSPGQQNAEFVNQQHLLQQQLNQCSEDARNSKSAGKVTGAKQAGMSPDGAAKDEARQIGKQDLITIKNRNVYIQPDDQDGDGAGSALGIPLAKVVGGAATNTAAEKDKLHIVVQDQRSKGSKKPADEESKEDGEKEGDNKVINYETFESSSEDEFSQGAFESAAQSFQNKEKNQEQNGSGFQEHKRQERQRRKERKHVEKRKLKAEQDRERRKGMRKKYRLQSQGIEQYDEYQDDVLNFKDSDRESVISYFEQCHHQDKVQIFQKAEDLDMSLGNMIDTPTRLVNHSNEFLPEKKKINPDKLAKKGNLLMKHNIKTFKDIEDQFSDIEKSQKSTFRRLEDDKKDMLFKIVSQGDIEKLQVDIQRQMGATSTTNSVDHGNRLQPVGEGIRIPSKVRGSTGAATRATQKTPQEPSSKQRQAAQQQQNKQPKRY